jgi:peptide deformylase
VSLLDIHVLGSDILRKETTPIAVVTPEIRTLIDDMFETMYVAQGIGLAAPQVGRPERVTVINIGAGPITLVNPEILEAEGTMRGEEGCLSIPDVYGDVDRASRVVVRALDREGQSFTIEGTELLARCLQHEIDHLHGRLFIDYLSVLKRRAALAKWATLRDDYPGLRRILSAKEQAKHPHHDGEL